MHITHTVFKIEEVFRTKVSTKRLAIDQQIKRSYSLNMGCLLTLNFLLVLVAVPGKFEQL